MFRKGIAQRSWLVWSFCAVAAPILQLLAGSDWKSLLIIGLAATAAVCILLGQEALPGWLSALQLVWLTVAIGACGLFAANSWPMGGSYPVIPLTLLALGCWSARKGPGAAAGTAGILFLLLCIGCGLVLGSGVGQLRWDWALGHERAAPGMAAFVFLLPAAAVCIPREGRKKRAWLLAVPVFCCAATLITCGNLHPNAHSDCFDFYEMCRSLSLLGMAERFEALVCCIITAGWFSTLSFLFSAIGGAAQVCFPGSGPKVQQLSAVAAGAMVLGKLHIDHRFLGWGAVIFWGVFPLITQGIVTVKNSRKKSK